ncbi:MAG: addiction module protein [Chitinophagales bacterium]
MSNPIEEILKLDKQARIKAASLIVNSIVEEDNDDLTPDQKVDLLSRIELYKKGEMTFTLWNEVYDEIRQKLK